MVESRMRAKSREIPRLGEGKKWSAPRAKGNLFGRLSSVCADALTSLDAEINGDIIVRDQSMRVQIY
jgi:hypothetical protein